MTENVSVPDQITEPNWDEVKYFAKQAAEATIEGKMAQANDFYQFIAIEVMDALYGPGSVKKFLVKAMEQDATDQKEKSRIVLA